MQPSTRRWFALAFHLPAESAYPRVKVWRRLQDIGAVSFKNSLYLLPASEDTLEDLEWILTEVRAAGGSGMILEGQAVAGLADGEITALFDRARESEYRELGEEIAAFTETLARKRAAPTPSEVATQLSRFRERLASIEAVDFFQANGRQNVQALLRALEPRGAAARARKEETMERPDAQALKNRLWVTRANVHVDRMASAWLIKRWIDTDARFKFVTERNYEPAADEVRFDMYDGEYTHDAERCTFEVLLDLVTSRDTALRTIGEIVHDLDLKDRKFEHEETAGVRQIIAGVIAAHANDEERLARSRALFDDLHASLSKR
jgi:hypothetical protein